MAQLWLWLFPIFGLPGTLLVLGLAGLLCCAWFFTAVSVWQLSRRSRRVEQHLLELRDRLATQSRHQQVQRLRHDKGRNRSGPR
jgi:hypothetical protein